MFLQTLLWIFNCYSLLEISFFFFNSFSFIFFWVTGVSAKYLCDLFLVLLLWIFFFLVSFDSKSKRQTNNFFCFFFPILNCFRNLKWFISQKKRKFSPKLLASKNSASSPNNLKNWKKGKVLISTNCIGKKVVSNSPKKKEKKKDRNIELNF